MTKRNSALHRGQGFDATLPHFYEAPMDDPDYLEVWCYTDALSYEAGETVNFHVSTTADNVSLQVLRDGGEQVEVYCVNSLEGQHHETAEDFYEKGCGWPVGYQWTIPDDCSSGFYLVLCKVQNDKGEVREHEAGFFVRPKVNKPTAKILMIAATSTWIAYNDWGGTSNYVGFDTDYIAGKSPQLSIHRPWAKGFLSLPPNAPRKPHEYKVRAGDIPRYPPIEFAYTRCYSKYYANAGWAIYEGPFAKWLEENGYSIDYATQHDLHYRPELLKDYPCVLMVGHDEYWTREMRLAIDHYIEQGGHFARFGGNFCWQIRFGDEGKTQVCYKEDAPEKDPVIGTKQENLTTTVWEHPIVNWPGAKTVGLNALYGIYANVGHIAPRQGGGFTVYRPEHWALRGTDLCYGDQFGNDANIFGYEVDGLDYEIKQGVPEPTYQDGALPNTEIIAMGLAGNYEPDNGGKGTVCYYADAYANPEGLALCRYGKADKKSQAAAARGNGLLISVQKGKGHIVNAGTCEWVAGLIRNDADTQIITRNILNRFMQGQ